MTQLRAAERSMRELLEESELPPPDEVEYRAESLVFLWHEMKLAVVIECDETQTAPTTTEAGGRPKATARPQQNSVTQARSP